ERGLECRNLVEVHVSEFLVFRDLRDVSFAVFYLYRDDFVPTLARRPRVGGTPVGGDGIIILAFPADRHFLSGIVGADAHGTVIVRIGEAVMLEPVDQFAITVLVSKPCLW